MNNAAVNIGITQMNRYHLTVMKTLLLSEISPDTNGQILHDFINIRYLELRESFLKQVDKSRGPQGERGLEFSRRKKGQTFLFFPSIHSLGLYNNNVSYLRTVSEKNLLANPFILKCKLWE